MIDCIELSTSCHRMECNIDRSPLRLSCSPFHFVPGLSKQSKSEQCIYLKSRLRVSVSWIFCCKIIDQIAKKNFHARVCLFI